MLTSSHSRVAARRRAELAYLPVRPQPEALVAVAVLRKMLQLLARLVIIFFPLPTMLSVPCMR